MTSPDPDAGPLSCPEMVELLTAYLDGALSAGDATRFEVHLDLCPGCLTYVDQFRETVEITGRLGEEQVPHGVMDQLLHAFRDWRAQRADL